MLGQIDHTRVAEFYASADRELPSLTRGHLTHYAMNYWLSPHVEIVRRCKGFSMLHEESLTVLNYAARRSLTVLEIGPYIGGSTVAIGEGLKAVPDPLHVVIEIGGAYDHPDYPSKDILGDLKQNIARYGLRGTHVIEGWSHSPDAVGAVRDTLAGRMVDLLFIDSDGHTDVNFQLYRPYLSPTCVLVLDDFLIYEQYATSKQADVRAWVGEAIDSGLVRDLGTFLWGTWAGQLV